MLTFQLPVEQISVLMFIFLRVTLILLFLPLFDSQNIPPVFKIGLALAVSILLLPMVQPTRTPDFTSGIPLLIGIVSEVLMGLGIGLCIKLIFVGVQLGGELAGFQMGLSMANVFDPGSGTSNSVVAQFKYIVAVLIFLSIDGHHLFFRAITDSFSLMPPFGFVLTESLMSYFLALVGKMFMVSVKLSSPVIVALLFTSVSLGLVARTVPQMNVFFVAMPIKLFIGFLFIGLMLPIFASLLVKIFNTVGTIMLTFIRLGMN